MNKLIIFLIMIISIQSFGIVHNKKLYKKNTSYSEGQSYSYMEQEVIDLCLISEVKEEVDMHEGKLVTFCKIERDYGQIIKQDLYLENCDDILSMAKRCSPYL